MILYVVGGASRSGKSILANRVNASRGTPWLSLDALMMSLREGAPALGIDPDEDDFETADKMWPVVRALARNLIFDGRDYLIEGACLRPRHAADLRDLAGGEGGTARACFLGYPGVDLAAKAEATAAFRGPNDWLRDKSAEFINRHLRTGEERSGHLKQECESSTPGRPSKRLSRLPKAGWLADSFENLRARLRAPSSGGGIAPPPPAECAGARGGLED
jgi:predicted kinase